MTVVGRSVPVGTPTQQSWGPSYITWVPTVVAHNAPDVAVFRDSGLAPRHPPDKP